MTILLKSPIVEKNPLSYDANGMINLYFISISYPLEIKKNNAVVFSKTFSASTHLKNLNKPNADRENYDSTIDSLNHRIFNSMIRIIKKLDEN